MEIPKQTPIQESSFRLTYYARRIEQRAELAKSAPGVTPEQIQEIDDLTRCTLAGLAARSIYAIDLFGGQFKTLTDSLLNPTSQTNNSQETT
jgi:hypothetical protein